MKYIFKILCCCLMVFLYSCGGNNNKEASERITKETKADTFEVKVDQFADLQILRYRVPGFSELSAKKKEQVYYLYQAALSGRDIIYDQNYKHNLTIRRTIEAIVEGYKGDRAAGEFEKFMTYAKRVWFSNGIHHHYSTRKFLPEFSKEYFAELVNNTDADFPLAEGQSKEGLLAKLTPIIFDPEVDAKGVNLDTGVDMVTGSANNYYENISQEEVQAYYSKKIDKEDKTPVLYGLNSKLVKVDGQPVEKVYKVGGMYTEAIEKIVFWLEKAASVAENEKQKAALDKLIEYYKTGDLEVFDEYNVAWVADTASVVDVINGFIEVYGDPLGYRGAYESVVSIRDKEASQRMAALAGAAQWFEDNSPIMDEHKKENVTGISYKVISVVVEAGDAAPSTPIGINLPNSAWIRKTHGSKSVSLGNIVNAYNEASSGGSVQEFALNEAAKVRAEQYGILAGKLHTALHEVIGHASGQLNEGVGTPKETLKSYASALEEGRADLVALYYMMDPKLVELGVMPSLEVGKTSYDRYIRNGLMVQLRRLDPGDNIEESHMRNRQMIASWVYEQGLDENVIAKKVVGGKTYFVVNDYQKLRDLFGQLLREVQRIKSEGDYEAGKKLIENYGVKVNQDMLKEVKERYASLHMAPYSGFIQPKLTPVMEEGKIIDVEISYPKDFVEQMMFYGKEYSFLPNYN